MVTRTPAGDAGSRRPPQAFDSSPQHATHANPPPLSNERTGPCAWWLADTGDGVAHDCDCTHRAGHTGPHACVCGNLWNH